MFAVVLLAEAKVHPRFSSRWSDDDLGQPVEGRPGAGELSGNEGGNGRGGLGECCVADVADGLVEGRSREPLHEFR